MEAAQSLIIREIKLRRSSCLSSNQLCMYSNMTSQLSAQELSSGLALGGNDKAMVTGSAVESNTVA